MEALSNDGLCSGKGMGVHSLLCCALMVGWPTYGAEAPSLSPQRTAAKVVQRLENDPIDSLSCVKVSVREQTATLSGTVTSLIASERAEQVARSVDGVSEVVNDIDVQPTLLLSPAEFRAALASLEEIGSSSYRRSGDWEN